MIIFGEKQFTNPIKIITAFNFDELKTAFAKIEELKNQYYIVGYLRYNAFSGQSSNFPLLYFEVFNSYNVYKTKNTKKLLLNPTPCVNFCEYSNAIKKIKEEIAKGNTYEVNYTYDFNVPFDGDELELFNFLLSKQKTPYNFYIKNQYDTVLSFSPELFFEMQNNHILTKPMKGTIHRGKDKKEDKNLIEFLKNDIKNRAENVMIVDLLRNDLGRIAKVGTVNVSKLFEIETHKTLHQMTSQIEADLKENTTFFDIFKAIFPCGSITGAPKISTMKVISHVEKGERNIYCGAIGMISPKETIFSVPIRILQKTNEQNKFKYRVGGAIVWDSNAQDEWEETLTKTKFLNDEFQIIETVKIENNSILFEKEHFERMQKTAEHFGFKFKTSEIAKTDSGMLRILLNRDGEIKTELKRITPAKTSKIAISPIIQNSKNEFLYYKTTYRPWYYDSFQRIKNGEIYDEIFFNEKGELTEGARSNIVLQLNGNLYTPPVQCGLLNGVFRQELLKNNKCTEKILYKKDLEILFAEWLKYFLFNLDFLSFLYSNKNTVVRKCYEFI